MNHSSSCYTSTLWRRGRLLLAGCVISTAWLACSPAGQDSPDAATFPQTLETHVVERMETIRYAELPATVRSVDKTTLAGKVMGPIVDIPLQLGQKVSAGELLVEIAAPEVDARVDQARVAVSQAERDLERERSLLDRNATTPETVRQLEDRAEAARARLAEAEASLDHTRIKAPFDGQVSRLFAHLGDLAAPGQALVELERSGPLELESFVPESLARRLDRESHYEAVADGESFSVQLLEKSVSADPRSRTVQTRFSLPLSQDLTPGSFVRLHLPSTRKEHIAIPAEAIRNIGQMHQVFVVEQDHAHMVLVRKGSEGAHGVEILAGLNGGERILARPPVSLRSGQRVTIQAATQ